MSEQSFRPEQRLHSPREFSVVLGSRRVIRGEFFYLHHVTAKAGIPRLGLVIPKRLARHAVLRNLIRRQARESFRYRANALPALDLVIRLTGSLKDIVGPKLIHEHKQRVRCELDALFDRMLHIAPSPPG